MATDDVLDASIDALASPDLVPGWHLAWAKHDGITAAGSALFTAKGLVLVADRLFVNGSLLGSAIFGHEEPEQALHTMDGVYLASYGTNGDFAWVRLGGHGGEGLSMTAISGGFVSHSGQLSEPMVFNEGLPDELTLHCPDPFDDCGFAVRYDVLGHALGGVAQGNDRINVWGADAGSHVWGTIVFSNTELTIPTFQGVPQVIDSYPDSSSDVVVVSWDTEGLAHFVLPLVGAQETWATGVVDGQEDQVYLYGYYEGAMTFAPGTPSELTLSPSTASSQFLAAVDRDGVVRWAQDIGPEESGPAHNVCDAFMRLRNGDLLTLGRVNGVMSVGEPGNMTSPEIPSEGRGIVIGRYTTEGVLVWRRVFTGSRHYTSAFGLAELADGSIAVAGRIDGEAVFGLGEENETRWEDKSGSSDWAYAGARTAGFAALLDVSGKLQWALRIGDKGPAQLGGVVVVPQQDTTPERLVFVGTFLGDLRIGTGGGDERSLSATGVSWDNEADLLLFALERDVMVSR